MHTPFESLNNDAAIWIRSAVGLPLFLSAGKVGAFQRFAAARGLATLSVLLVSSMIVRGQTYTITDLGTLGGTLSAAEAINTTGKITGYSTPAVGSARAFLWTGGGMTTLGTNGGRWSYGTDINSSGQIVGHYNTVATAPASFDTAFVHTDGVFATLPTLGGGSGYALGINDAGTVVGNAFLANNTTRHAFVYAGGVLTDLTPDIGNRNSSATDINNAGIIVGYRELTSPVDQTGFYYNGTHFVNLKLGGSRSTATAINSAGWVVGQSSITGNTKQHGFLFNGEAVLDLGDLGGTQSSANDINSMGQVVGSSTIAGNLVTHATLFANGTLHDLNNLLSESGGWVLNEALGINDAGAIVGFGTIGGQQHAFLLTPAGVPAGPYQIWAAAKGLISAGLDDPLLDPDQDGLNNLFECFLGGQPLGHSDADKLPAISTTPGGRIVFRYRVSAAGAGLAPQVQILEDGIRWVTATPARDGLLIEPGPPETDGTPTVLASFPQPAGGSLLIRLAVSLP
jgi:probable HAF family extracellular repeat protein